MSLTNMLSWRTEYLTKYQKSKMPYAAAFQGGSSAAAGVNLIYIRDFLDHSDIKTTGNLRKRADTELKRKALENATGTGRFQSAGLERNSDLMAWLSEL